MEPSTSKEINIDTVLIGEMDLFPDDHKDPQAAVKIETSHDESADQMDINVSISLLQKFNTVHIYLLVQYECRQIIHGVQFDLQTDFKLFTTARSDHHERSSDESVSDQDQMDGRKAEVEVRIWIRSLETNMIV